jgi:hypothetical protein
MYFLWERQALKDGNKFLMQFYERMELICRGCRQAMNDDGEAVADARLHIADGSGLYHTQAWNNE